MAVISVFWRQKQEDWKLRVTLGYTANFETLFQKQIFLLFLQVFPHSVEKAKQHRY